MKKIISENEVIRFKKDGAILLKNKFKKKWIDLLKDGINKAKDQS